MGFTITGIILEAVGLGILAWTLGQAWRTSGHGYAFFSGRKKGPHTGQGQAGVVVGGSGYVTANRAGMTVQDQLDSVYGDIGDLYGKVAILTAATTAQKEEAARTVATAQRAAIDRELAATRHATRWSVFGLTFAVIGLVLQFAGTLIPVAC